MREFTSKKHRCSTNAVVRGAMGGLDLLGTVSDPDYVTTTLPVWPFTKLLPSLLVQSAQKALQSLVNVKGCFRNHLHGPHRSGPPDVRQTSQPSVSCTHVVEEASSKSKIQQKYRRNTSDFTNCERWNGQWSSAATSLIESRVWKVWLVLNDGFVSTDVRTEDMLLKREGLWEVTHSCSHNLDKCRVILQHWLRCRFISPFFKMLCQHICMFNISDINVYCAIVITCI